MRTINKFNTEYITTEAKKINPKSSTYRPHLYDKGKVKGILTKGVWGRGCATD